MRIRKRQLPFPLSSFLSSDPHLNRSPGVQLNNPHGNLTPPPSDRPNHHPIGVETTVSDSSDKKMERDCLELKQEKATAAAAAAAAVEGQEEERRVVERRSNDTRKKSILGAEVGSGSGPSSHHAGERWYEEEKVFPLKKRRGRFVEDEMIMEKDKKANAKMKAKMNKKCVQQQNDNDAEEIKEVDGGSTTTTTGARKRSRGGALMEGSRCSRVNGRGWRCCQQTLVGYSLCEHHLGKGRLRSMNSVSRSRSLTSTSTTAPEKDNVDHEPLSSSSSLQDKNIVVLDDDGDQTGNTDKDEKKPLMTTTTKKKMKLGMVKARSISSLLGQTNNAIACAVDENK